MNNIEIVKELATIELGIAKAVRMQSEEALKIVELLGELTKLNDKLLNE